MKTKKMLGLKIDNKFTVYYTHYIFDKRYKKLQENGIQVKFFPYTQGISTTQLREKLKG